MTSGRQELARAGYAWEIGDAPILHASLSLADLAHVLELERLHAIPAETCRILVRELLHILELPSGAIPYDPAYGEMYSSRERYLIGRIGDNAGWLHSGRTRREAMRIAYRLVVRQQILDLIGAACGLAGALCDQGGQHVETVMPDYTYLQPANPTTFGHYLLSFVDPVIRDARRLQREFADVNGSPAGAGAASGSALLRDRESPGRDLGFDGPIAHVRDAMWQTDPFIHTLLSATTLVVGEDKLAEDLEIFASREFDFVALGDGLVRASVLMPQKRNPYALTVVRGAAGILIGRATGQLSIAKSPSARSDLYIYAYGEVPRALDLAITSTELMAAVVGTLRVNEPRMESALAGQHTTATDMAMFLIDSFDIDFRTAHSVIARAVSTAALADREVSPQDIAEAGEALTGRVLEVSGEQMKALADPMRVVRSHAGIGGSAPGSTVAFIEGRRELVDEMRNWVLMTRARIEDGEQDVIQRARALVGGDYEREDE